MSECSPEQIGDYSRRQTAVLYGQLAPVQPSPVVELHRAIAIAMRDGPEAGLTLIDSILARDELRD